MIDFPAYKKKAIRYWERRRIVYNMALVLPSILGYLSAAELSIAVGDRGSFGFGGIAALFLASALGANICYSFAYALEFLFGSDEPSSSWLQFGRSTALVSGTVFAMILALVGGRNIAIVAQTIHWDRFF